jgi:enoyl-CoA hydratase/carnithine racemase
VTRSETPAPNPDANLQPAGITRRGAAMIVTTEDAARLTLAARSLCATLHLWARDAELYAVIFDVLTQPLVPAVAADGSGPIHRCVSEMIWRLECFSKPSVSLLAGSVGATSMAIACAGTHRVVVPEAKITCAAIDQGHLSPGNNLPPGNLLKALAELPGAIGAYLLLTGRTLTAADALAIGLVTHIVPARQLETIRAGLADADPIDPLLDDLHVPGAGAVLAERHGLIARHFGQVHVVDIVASLRAETGADQAWAAAVADDIGRRAQPVAERALVCLRAAGRGTVSDALILAHRANLIAGSGLAGNAGATGDAVLAALAQSQPDDLVLPTRAELQSLRRM